MSRMLGIEFIADHYGLEAQLGMLQEECAELIQAVNKWRRGGSASGVIEEMADVELMIAQIAHLLACEATVHEIVDEKIARQYSRIAEEGER